MTSVRISHNLPQMPGSRAGDKTQAFSIGSSGPMKIGWSQISQTCSDRCEPTGAAPQVCYPDAQENLQMNSAVTSFQIT